MNIFKFKQVCLIAFSFVLLNLATVNSWAEEELTTDIVELSFNTGYFDYAEGREFDNSAFIGWGLGLQLTENWRTILNYSELNNEKLDDGDELYIQKYQGDVVYTFNTQGTWRPYIVGSFGELDTRVNGEHKYRKQYTQYGIGAGLTYAISSNWFVHSEFHSYYSNPKENVDLESKVMIAYRFGNGEG
ncbi:MAG: porin family protein [Oleispira sp.]|nr:porin family protein [Oleispira sp.]MBL4880003.1 porin family protein [Oleispira sp.]